MLCNTEDVTQGPSNAINERSNGIAPLLHVNSERLSRDGCSSLLKLGGRGSLDYYLSKSDADRRAKKYVMFRSEIA